MPLVTLHERYLLRPSLAIPLKVLLCFSPGVLGVHWRVYQWIPVLHSLATVEIFRWPIEEWCPLPNLPRLLGGLAKQARYMKNTTKIVLQILRAPCGELDEENYYIIIIISNDWATVVPSSSSTSSSANIVCDTYKNTTDETILKYLSNDLDQEKKCSNHFQFPSTHCTS